MNFPASQLPGSLYRAEQVRAMDRCAIDEFGIAGYELMQRAGDAAFACLRELLPSGKTPLQTLILVLCGGGNNGGDGYVIARYALNAGYRVHVLALTPPADLHADAAIAAADWQRSGGVTLQADRFVNDDAFACYDAIVDALLGTGLQRAVAGEFARVIDLVNRAQRPVLAVDVPSGLAADNGQPLGTAIHATMTISFIGLKRGLFTGSAADYCGCVRYADLGVPEEVLQRVAADACLIDAQELAQVLPQRARTAHKGLFGHVLVIGGDAGMAGAAQMAAMAALRAGAGLVSIATQAAHAAQLSAGHPELMSHAVSNAKALRPLLERATVLVAGPGLGQSSWSRELLKTALAAGLPTVIDADALNLLAAGAAGPATEGNWILTPHPGEAARLLGVSAQEIQADRFHSARAICQRYSATVVLKGAGTLVSASYMPVIAVCNRGHPGMATAGMGDILSGVIAALAAQHKDMFAAARAGVWLHAVAAEHAAAGDERGVAATDLLPAIRQMVNEKSCQRP